MTLTDTPTGVTTGFWSADWVLTPQRFKGTSIRILNLAQTNLNVVTEEDVKYYRKFGRLPEFSRIALNVAWGFPTPRWDLTASREEFDAWRRNTGPGRRPEWSYEAVVALRRHRVYDENFVKARHGLDPHTFYMIATGRAYWWVQTGDPDWMGWHWEDKGISQTWTAEKIAEFSKFLGV